jgi:homogentisate 1,2-dioxygenase
LIRSNAPGLISPGALVTTSLETLLVTAPNAFVTTTWNNPEFVNCAFVMVIKLLVAPTTLSASKYHW